MNYYPRKVRHKATYTKDGKLKIGSLQLKALMALYYSKNGLREHQLADAISKNSVTTLVGKLQILGLIQRDSWYHLQLKLTPNARKLLKDQKYVIIGKKSCKEEEVGSGRHKLKVSTLMTLKKIRDSSEPLLELVSINHWRIGELLASELLDVKITVDPRVDNLLDGVRTLKKIEKTKLSLG